MATDTVPAAASGPSEPPDQTAAGNQPAMGFLASMLAPVEPARPTFDLSPTTDSSTAAASADEALDRSAPGVSSASFRDAEQAAAKDAAGEKQKAQGSIWKAMWLAGAQRWAKGGGTANKRFDVQKAKAQAHQVKESRTTSVTNSGGLHGRNSVGSGGASKGNAGKAGGDSRGKGPSNSSRNGSSGAGRGGSGGGRGASGSSGSTGSGSGAGRDKKADNRGKSAGPNGSEPGGKGAAGASGNSGTGAPGKSNAGKQNSDGKGSSPKGSGSAGATGSGSKGTTSGAGGKSGAAGKDGKPGKSGTAGGGSGHGQKSDTRTPLEKSREIGHKDGGAVRNVIDHVKAYKDGTVDGYRDKSEENAKEHDRLDKAHTSHKKKADQPKAGKPTEQEDDGVSTDVKPLTIKHIDANALTLGTDGARGTVSRRELRNFKQYERKLEDKETVLQKIAEACKQLEKQAEDEAQGCQDLAEQAKSVEGGEKVLATLNRLTEVAKSQAAEAAELARCTRRAAEMCKVVLTNIQTRYAPLYKAVVDSDETKPAELRFYNDKGSYAPAA